MRMHLRDNDELGGLILDTEAQSLATANGMDCGQFDDMLRKAFEHEDLESSYISHGMRPVSIHFPKLAILLTGTPEQFYQLIENPENGLFSRVLFYTYREHPQWKEMNGEDTFHDEWYESLSARAFELFRFCMEHPLNFNFTAKQWRRLNEKFGKMLVEVVAEGEDDLQAVVKRHAFIVMRIAMILTRLRLFEKGDISSRAYCEDIDFETAVSLVITCYEHSRLILTSMSSGKKHILQNPNLKRLFFEALPESFTTEDALILAANYGFSKRTVMRYLNEFNGVKINKISKGKYVKL